MDQPIDHSTKSGVIADAHRARIYTTVRVDNELEPFIVLREGRTRNQAPLRVDSRGFSKWKQP